MAPGSDQGVVFLRRVNDYLKYGPGYPAALADTLRHRIGYSEAFVIADIGSGTGISSEFFLSRGNWVYAIDPHPDMRRVSQEWLGGYTKFRAVAARAEATTLPADSVDLVVAAQSFHRFDRELARREFTRVLRPGRYVALIQNERLTETTVFLRAYELLLAEFLPSSAQVSRYPELDTDTVESFFDGELWGRERFANRQSVDFEGLIGRSLGDFHLPRLDDARHAELRAALRSLFDEHSARGEVAFEYTTHLVWGRMSRP